MFFRAKNKRAAGKRNGVSTGGAKAKRKKNAQKAVLPENDLHTMTLFIALIALFIWALAAATVVYRRTLPTHGYVVGQQAEQTIYTEVEFAYVDYEATERRRQEARREVPLVFRVNQEVNQVQLRLIESIHEYYRGLAEPSAEPETLPSEVPDSPPPAAGVPETPPPAPPLVETLEGRHSRESMKQFLADDDLRSRLRDLLHSQLQQGVRPEEAADLFLDQPGPRDPIRILVPNQEQRSVLRPLAQVATPQQAKQAAIESLTAETPELTSEQKDLATTLAGAVITPNLSLHPQRTEELRQTVASQVENVMRTIAAGEILVQRGERLSAEHLEKLDNYFRQIRGRQRETFGLIEDLAAALLLLVLVLGFARALVLFDPASAASRSRILLMVSIVALQLLLARLAIHLFTVHEISSFYLLAALPAALGGVLAAQLVGLRIAILSTLFCSLTIALQVGGRFDFFMVASIAGVIGALLVYRARRRIEMFKAGIWLGLSFFFLSSLFYANRGIPPEAFGCLAVVALLNGFGTAVIASTIMPVFEYAFGVSTDISLLEMSDLNHPLLRRLQIEAPGTFHHSLMVAILAEQAADAIGANPLLARVSAYFHDIGKISQAEYFTENAMAAGSRDAHTNLQPRMSSLIILNHVKEGLALAASHKLNKTLREAIAQHHGTSLIYYFYRRAAEQHAKSGRDDKSPGQHDYRYPGPLPMRREVVLIGIADACEAAARSLQKPSPQKLKNLVAEIISAKLHDGQLDQADLTFQELAIARETMVKTLCTMYHGRIAYPKEPGKENGEDAAQPDSQSPQNAGGVEEKTESDD